MLQRHIHCSYCGARFEEGQKWPRRCAACENTSFISPLPVAVLLLPVDDGVLVIRRGIPPAGKLALPGGYIDWGEAWQAAAARELLEETGITIDPAEVRELRTVSTPDGSLLLLFCCAERRSSADLPPFAPTNETTERLIIRAPSDDMAFALHAQIIREWFEGHWAHDTRPMKSPRSHGGTTTCPTRTSHD